MEGAKQKDVSPPDERQRWMLVFSLGGDLRFISHHDTLRLFRRVLARADIPVRFTEGFNPHPKVMIPLPRAVGIASRDDALVFESDRALEPVQALQRLQEKTPNDIQVLALHPLGRGEQLEPLRVRYQLDLHDMNIGDLEARIDRLKAAEAIPVERISPKTKAAKMVDIRPFLEDLRSCDLAVEFTLKYVEGATAKPSEVARALGCEGHSIHHRIDRLEIQWKSPQRT